MNEKALNKQHQNIMQEEDVMFIRTPLPEVGFMKGNRIKLYTPVEVDGEKVFHEVEMFQEGPTFMIQGTGKYYKEAPKDECTQISITAEPVFTKPEITPPVEPEKEPEVEPEVLKVPEAKKVSAPKKGFFSKKGKN